MSTTFETRQHARDELAGIRTRLVAEFAFQLPAGTVVRHVGHAHRELADMGVRAGLPHAVEAMARKRLTLLRGEAPLR